MRTLDDIRDRCRIDAITGCWKWAMAMSDGGKQGASKVPRANIPAGVIAEKSISSTASRAAWILAGKPLTSGQVVWRTCCVESCVNPDHMQAGTKKQEGAWVRASGHNQGNPRRAAINLAVNAKSQALSQNVVRDIEGWLAAGRMQKDLAAELGVHKATISKIANGKHMHQRAGIRASSVFAWRPA